MRYLKLSNLSVRKKFVLLIGAPTLALLAISAIEIVRLNAEIISAKRFERLSDLSVHSSQALHEMQKERGASAGFLGSSGTKFRQILTNQRQETNLKLTKLTDKIAVFDTNPFDTDIKELLLSVESSLSQLSGMRRSVDRLSVEVKDQVKFYTDINDLLLAVSDALSRHSPSSEIANTGTAFATFLQSKERAGIERAVLSNAFSRKAFGSGVYEKFTNLVNTQSVYLDVFKDSANEEMLSALESVKSDPSFGEVDRMRNQAKESYVTGEFSVDAELWFGTITKKIEQLKSVENILAGMVVRDAETQLASINSVRGRFFMALSGSLIVSLVLGWIISSQILKSISNARSIALAINSGYLDTPAPICSTDEVGDLLTALSSMQKQLKGIVTSTQSVSTIISSKADDIHSSAASLSQCIADQSSSLISTSSSTEQISSTVRHNAERASEAQKLVHQAHSYAEEGGNVVERAVSAMGEITDSSREISEIISVIDDIAFQTNLLALNAAVEAARAGEQGRGFAVVASEVRTLAGRSAEAAREIKQLITRSVEKVESGSEMVGRSGNTLKQIVESVSEVRSLMDAMATAGREQANGVEEINHSMVEIDGITQKNTVMVKEVSVASETMKKQAQSLVDELSFFRVGEVSASSSEFVVQGGMSDNRHEYQKSA